MSRRVLTAVIIALVALPHVAAAQEPPTSWQIRKCQIYRSAWDDLPMLMDTSSISQRFKTLNEAFLASDCLGRVVICPEGQGEIDAANFLTIAAMNGGAASTFLPFRC